MSELAAERTWDDNRKVINDLWPVVKFTDEERRLWHDDLSGFDQSMLYDAIRNVKRSHDSVYPQLKWILDAYRELAIRRRAAISGTSGKPKEPKVCHHFDDAEDRRRRREYIEWIESASPTDYRAIYDHVFDMENFRHMKSQTVSSLILYAKERLLGIKPVMGRVINDGDGVTPLYTYDKLELNEEVSL